MTELWVEKYKPTTIDSLIITKETKLLIKKWIYDFKHSKKNSLNCLFLHGPPGIGKTTMAHVILKEYGYKVYDLNSSETRTGKYIKDKLHDILYKKNVINLMTKKTKETGIIMDEIDGLSLGERGGLSEFIKIVIPKKKEIKESKSGLFNYLKRIPFICISNTLDKKLSELKSKTLYIHLKKPSFFQLERLATTIMKNEKCNYDSKQLNILVKKSQLDFRKLITLLQYTYNSKKTTKKETSSLIDSFGLKHIDHTAYESTSKILNTYNDIDITIELYEPNKSLIGMLVYENAVYYINNNKTLDENDKLKKIQQIYNNFSISDLFDYNIYITQQWDLYNYDCVLKCSYNSYIINEITNNFNKSGNTIQFSTLLNKTSFEYLNLKTTSSIEHDTLKHSESIKMTDLYSLIDYYKPSELKNILNISSETVTKINKILDK